MKYLLKQLKQYRTQSILAPLFKMLEATFDLLVPLVVARLIDQGIGGNNVQAVWSYAGILVLMAIVGLLMSFTAQYFAARAAIGTATGLRHQLFSHIQSLGFSEMDTIGISTLITRMTGDINQVQSGINMFLRLFLRSPFVVVGAVVMAFTIDAGIALWFVVGVVLLTIIVVGIMRITRPKYKANQGLLDQVTGSARENMSGVRVIRAFGMEEREKQHFSEVNNQLTNAQLQVGRISSLMNPLTTLVVNGCIVLILWIGSSRVDSGLLLSGSVIALVNYMNQILVELVKLANLVVTLSRAMASLSRVEQVLDTEAGMKFPEVSAALKNPDEAVRFDHVSLAYAGAGAESLTDISFSVKSGETIGVIGGTGSGKTSVTALIPRFYDATDGTVSLWGTPITEIDRNTLRNRISVVMQRAQLFTGTIRSNMLWGTPEADDDAIWTALEAAQAADFVRSKPQQLDEEVEQGGRNFSGGQRQRLTIARALIHQPEILILDDSSSALDYATDAALRSALRKLPWNPTVFIVSQRTASLQHADHILVLDDGHAVGWGTHEELLESCTVYREIYDSQFKKGDA